MNGRIRFIYDTSTNWSTNNPILLSGEIGLESDNKRFKVGNGTDSWNSLKYFSNSYSKSNIDRIFGSFIDKNNYFNAMKAWFTLNTTVGMTDFTELCRRWYTLSRTGWTGGTIFYNDDSTLSTGDNSGLICLPSTSLNKNTDDYRTMPQFAHLDCNAYLDSSGKKHITAIDGICGEFTKTDPSIYVCSIQMSLWFKYTVLDDGYSYDWTDNIGKSGYRPWQDAINIDNTIEPFVIHAKYAAADDVSGYHNSFSGAMIKYSTPSYSGCITEMHRAGNQYCAKTSSDDAFIKHMMYLKYKSLTLDGIMNGCNYYYYDYTPAVATTNQSYVILTTAQGESLIVGSTLQIGTSARGGTVSVRDKRITKIENMVVDSTTYSAVYLDSESFSTVTTDHVCTMHWYTGSCDSLNGYDGSPYSNTSNKEPFVIQGIEMMYGAYEVLGDSFLTYTDGNLRVNVCRDATKLATSVTSDYITTNYSIIGGASDAWSYIKRLGYDNSIPEVMFPSVIGGSSSTFTRDAIYIKSNTTNGNYEWLSLGPLSGGSSDGVSCVAAGFGLSNTHWSFASRLSPNGMRGEYVSA